MIPEYLGSFILNTVANFRSHVLHLSFYITIWDYCFWVQEVSIKALEVLKLFVELFWENIKLKSFFVSFFLMLDRSWNRLNWFFLYFFHMFFWNFLFFGLLNNRLNLCRFLLSHFKDMLCKFYKTFNIKKLYILYEFVYDMKKNYYKKWLIRA